MAITKAEFRTMVRQYIDDPSGKHWTDIALDMVIQSVLDDVATDLLDTQGYLNSQYQQFTSAQLHTPGYVDLRQTVYGGDLVDRLYRVQSVVADGYTCYPKDPRDYLLTTNGSSTGISSLRSDLGEARFTFQFLGNQLWIHPLGSINKVELRYSYKPTKFTNLANGTLVELPDGSENAATLLCAAHGMLKGDEEDNKNLLIASERARERMLASIRRQYHGMTIPFSVENSWSWGGI